MKLCLNLLIFFWFLVRFWFYVVIFLFTFRLWWHFNYFSFILSFMFILCNQNILRTVNFTHYSIAKFAWLRWHNYCHRYHSALIGDSAQTHATADFLTQHFSIKTAKIAELAPLKQPYFCRFSYEMLLKIQCRDCT